jgi:prevent-host-death family protein
MVEASVTDLRQSLLEYLRQVEEDGEEIVVLRHGRPVVRIVPARPRPATLFGVDASTVTITDPDDDLLNTGEVWESA